jgi:hypothetical protein
VVPIPRKPALVNVEDAVPPKTAVEPLMLRPKNDPVEVACGVVRKPRLLIVVVPVAPNAAPPEESVPAAKRFVPVAFTKLKLPERESVPPSVVLPETLKAPRTVEEPLTKSDVVVPPAKENAWPVMRPVFEILKSVVVAQRLVEDEMVKRFKACVVVVGEAPIEKSAYGVVVPMPRVPCDVMVVVAVAPKEAVLPD